MKSLWPIVMATLLLVAFVAFCVALYTLGSLVGGVIEALILAIPGFLYHLPSNVLTAMNWLGSCCWSLLTNPLRTFCVMLGMLLVFTYFRGISGAFDRASPTIRGSSVRSAQEVFPDFDESTLGSPYEDQYRWRGSSLSSFDSLFGHTTDSLRSRLWNRIKQLITRNSGGDDLL